MRTHLFHISLTLTTPGGVTAPESRAASGGVGQPALVLARDIENRPVVPASSIAGSLRQACEPDRRPALFGDVTRKDEDETTAIASRVWVLGTDVTVNGDVAERRRTAIDRHRSAAAVFTLRPREVLPAESSIDIWLRIDGDSADGELRDLLSRWRPVIGGGRTTGHGQARITSARQRTLDLSDDDDLLHWLTHGGPSLLDGADSIEIDSPAHLPSLFAPMTFLLDGGLRIGNGSTGPEAEGTDTALLLKEATGPDGVERAVIPGSTWKGILRSRTELILRTVGLDACSSVTDDGPCGRCPVCRAFGWSGQHDGASVGLRGSIIFDDTPVYDGEIRVRNHVSIDRVFGGAADGLLYSEEVVEGGTITLDPRLDTTLDPEETTLDSTQGEAPRALTPGVTEEVRAAMVLALEDIARGRVGIGSSTTRGLGTFVPDEQTHAWLNTEVPRARTVLRDATQADVVDQPETREAATTR